MHRKGRELGQVGDETQGAPLVLQVSPGRGRSTLGRVPGATRCRQQADPEVP